MHAYTIISNYCIHSCTMRYYLTSTMGRTNGSWSGCCIMDSNLNRFLKPIYANLLNRCNWWILKRRKRSSNSGFFMIRFKCSSYYLFPWKRTSTYKKYKNCLWYFKGHAKDKVLHICSLGDICSEHLFTNEFLILNTYTSFRKINFICMTLLYIYICFIMF